MRPCSSATAALLANPPPGLRSADLFTFTLQDGVTVYRWTSFDRDLTVNGQVYSSRKPWLQRSRWSVANTMEVPTLEVTLSALNDAFGGGADIKAQITNGLFDGATATLDRVWLDLGAVSIVNGNPVINDLTVSNPTTTADVNIPGTSITTGSNTVTLSGFATTDFIQFSKPAATSSGGLLTWDAYSAWPTDSYSGPNPPPVPGQTWQNFVSIYGNNGGGDVLLWTASLSANNYLTIADAFAALAAQMPQTFTGYLTYKVMAGNDPNPSDNRGGLSLLVQSGPTNAGIRLMGGNVANIDLTGNVATINIKGKVNLLDQYAPRNLYQLGCEHAFCDAGCTLARSAFTTAYTVGTAPTRTFIPWSGTAPANATNYRFGTVTFTSGPCAGQARTVRAADSSGLTLIHPLVGTPVAGDDFTAFEGCDKFLDTGSRQDCTARSNTQNWRAFPFVPPADTAF
jgi:hypothetical protein